MSVYRIAITFTLASFIGCTDSGYIASKTNEKVYSEIKANNFEYLDLSKFGGKDWTKVCFFGPYTQTSEKTLGFDWQVSDHTDVLESDEHNVIVFATESKVIEYIAYPRSQGDFWQLSDECFSRHKSNFIKGSRGDFIRPKA